jgi:hypothetical protein
MDAHGFLNIAKRHTFVMNADEDNQPPMYMVILFRAIIAFYLEDSALEYNLNSMPFWAKGAGPETVCAYLKMFY